MAIKFESHGFISLVIILMLSCPCLLAEEQAPKKVLVTDHLPPLQDFMESNGFSEYFEAFLNYGFDDMQYVMRMEEKEMRIFGMSKDEIALLTEKIAELKVEKEAEVVKKDPLMELRLKQEYGRMYVNRSVQSFEFLTAFFGGPVPLTSGRLQLSNPWDSCAPQVAKEEKGAESESSNEDVFLIAGRGNCSFLEKVGNLSLSAPPLPTVLLFMNDNDTIIRAASGHAPGPREMQEEETGIHIPENISVAMLKRSSYLPLIRSMEHEEVHARMVPLYCQAGNPECLPVLEEEKQLIPQVESGRLILQPGGKTVEFMTSTFGGLLPSDRLGLATANPIEGCSDLQNPDELAGKIAVMRRGTCGFGYKAERAQNASARAVIIIDTSDSPLQNVAATDEQSKRIFIPALFISSIGGNLLEATLNTQEGSKATAAIIADNSIAYRWMELSIIEWPDDKAQQRLLYFKLLEENEDSEERMGWISNKYTQVKSEKMEKTEL